MQWLYAMALSKKKWPGIKDKSLATCMNDLARVEGKALHSMELATSTDPAIEIALFQARRETVQREPAVSMHS
jgi:hypothetical protein